jgi:hypothetical protein
MIMIWPFPLLLLADGTMLRQPPAEHLVELEIAVTWLDWQVWAFAPALCGSTPPFQASNPARVDGTVTFEPDARAAGHTYPRGQTLIVTAGMKATGLAFRLQLDQYLEVLLLRCFRIFGLETELDFPLANDRPGTPLRSQ